ncbi:MAG: hypothetical protein KW793_02435 [Candidatus Doudnabacteria bacterium]|nr:hypothetical protein [Candidatus Doudnabacteria bacterium]
MKISNYLPHFSEACLLVSSGKQEAEFFLIENDEVEEVHHLKVNKPEYTDRESRTERRSDSGRMFGGGGSFKHQEDELERSFIKKLSEATSNLTNEHKAKQIYLFCPTYLSKQIEASLPNDLRKKIMYIFYGNYQHQHPFVLLSKIQEFLRLEKADNQVDVIKGEAYDILKNTDGLENRIY